MAPAPEGRVSSAPPRRPSILATVAALRIVDVLVFRRIGPSTWAHLGGMGRGEGWAGIIDVDAETDSLAYRIPEQPGTVHFDRFDAAQRILGPYYATAGAIVRVSPDIAVVLGNPAGAFANTDPAAFITAAQRLSAEIDDVMPTKRLADELEILSAVRDVMDTPTDRGIAVATDHLLRISMQALSCEVGAFRDGDGHVLAIGDGATPHATWQRIFDEFEGHMTERQFCSDDRDMIPSATLLAEFPEACAALAAPIPAPLHGTLVFLHTAQNPRGYSLQCRRLLDNIVDAAGVVVRTAIMHDELRRNAAEATQAARTDPLTGLGNRLSWDEAIASAQELVDDGGLISVITVDVDGLKAVNDAYGHAAGDDLLRRCADIIRKHCTDNDLAVRMGGDEFAILVPLELNPDTPSFVAFEQDLSAPESTVDAVAASTAVRAVRPGGSVFDALREADLAMYARKRERRAARGITG